MDYGVVFGKAIEQVRAEGRYRVFADICRQRGSFPRARHFGDTRNDDITVWCSNDYLGMGQHPAVLAAMHEALRRLARARVARATSRGPRITTSN